MSQFFSSCLSLSIIFLLAMPLYSQNGLPLWHFSSSDDNLFQQVNWNNNPIDVSILGSPNFSTNSRIGTAFNECGEVVFVAFHTDANAENSLFFYDSNASPLLTNTTPNGPGLNAVKGNQELQVVPVPGIENQWYIIYTEWSDDANAVNNNAIYAAARLLYSRVESNGSFLNVIERDLVLSANGAQQTYTGGRGVSNNVPNQPLDYYLYATRRANNSSSLSLDRFLISETGISWQENSGNVNVGFWNLTMAGSPVEITEDGQKIAVVNRNEADDQPDVIIFDANNFTAAAAESIFLQELFLPADNMPNDQSNELNTGDLVENIAANPALELQWLQNLPHKVSGAEWSPNGQYLYLTGGGFAEVGFSNLTYLMQLDLNTSPYTIRLQVQETPNNGYNILSGAGCSFNVTVCQELLRYVTDVQSSIDGNLYFSKLNDTTLYIIPTPNDAMPQNLLPSLIDISNPTEQNILLNAKLNLLPEQIDGFAYVPDILEIDTITIDTFACAADAILLLGESINAGETLYTFGPMPVCDTIYEIIVEELLPIDTEEERTICFGETTDVFGNEISSAGSYEELFQSTQGCDSTHTINVLVLPQISIASETTETCPNEESGAISIQISGGNPPYSVNWNTGDNTLEINNLGIGTYTVAVTDANNCTYEEDINIGAVGSAAFAANFTEPSCHGDDDGTIFVETENDALTFSLDGTFFSQDTLFNNLTAGIYTVFAQDSEGCIYEQEITLTQPAQVVLELPADTLLLLGDSLRIVPFLGAYDTLSFTWSPTSYLDCSDCPNPVTRPLRAVAYILTVQDTFGCSATDEMLVSVKTTRELFMPTAFSPDFDGLNDKIYPFADASVIALPSFKIYDRWGSLVYSKNSAQANDANFGWDGKINGRNAPIGVYIYIIEAEFIDGVTEIFRGDFTLLR